MDRRQKIAIGALPVLVLMMLGVYRGAAWLFGRDLAWYAGFCVYWPIWGVLFPWWMLGRQKFWGLFRSQRLDVLGWSLLVFPPLMTFFGHFIMEYDQVGAWGKVVLVLMTFATGTLEEVLWRGVYITLFPGERLWGFVWPTLWFALWHLAPGSVSTVFNPWVLIAGAAVYGACWGWLAMKMGTIRWSVASHILTGLVRVLAS